MVNAFLEKRYYFTQNHLHPRTGIDIENVATTEVVAGSRGCSRGSATRTTILMFKLGYISTSTKFWNGFGFWYWDLWTELSVVNWLFGCFWLGWFYCLDRLDGFDRLLWLGDDHFSSSSSLNELPRCFSASQIKTLVMETLWASAFRWIRCLSDGLQRKVMESEQISMGMCERWSGRVGSFRTFRTVWWDGERVVWCSM